MCWSLHPHSCVTLRMQRRTSEHSKGQVPKSFQGEGPNWILIAGGALLSTLSIRLGYKLKQTLDAKQPENTCSGTGNSVERKKSGGYHLFSNGYCFAQEDDESFNYVAGTQGRVEIEQQHGNQLMTDPDMTLPLVTVPPAEFNKENGVIWASSPDRLELPQKPFHHSNSSESPCVSESGSEVFSKREVIQKLRQQLKRRDDMTLEMQDQIVELQSSLEAQLSHSSHLQSLLDNANRDLLDSEREIQRLRKAIADHCMAQIGPNDNPSTVWQSDAKKGHVNGYVNVESPEKGRGTGERIEMLKREVVELKEVIEGKEFLLHSYKEQKTELSAKVKELQQRLDSQLPNIL